MQYDLIIPCAAKDYHKLELCIKKAEEYLYPKPCNIYIVAPDKIKIPQKNIHYISDGAAIPIDIEDIKYHRKNWIYQQLIKLGQKFTENDYYLCLDSDVFFNRPIDLFQDGKPCHFLTNIQQRHQPYFNFMKKVFNLDPQIGQTFICDFMLMHKNISEAIIKNIKSFSKLINGVLSENCLLSEYELYGNYVQKYMTGTHILTPIKAVQYGSYDNKYVLCDIQHMINQPKDIDVIAVHTWT